MSTSGAVPLSLSRVRDDVLLGRNAGCLTQEGVGALCGQGVTHVVAVTVDSSLVELGRGVAFLRVPVLDDIGAPLHAHLEATAAFIHGAVTDGGRACVCCAGGVSAGPAVVMYYLMRHGSMSLSEALDTVCAAQPEAQPNIGFIQRLIEAEAWLRGGLAPSLSIQAYKWRFLQRLFPEADRQRVFEALHAARHEIGRHLENAEKGRV